MESQKLTKKMRIVKPEYQTLGWVVLQYEEKHEQMVVPSMGL